jgi:serpin B
MFHMRTRRFSRTLEILLFGTMLLASLPTRVLAIPSAPEACGPDATLEAVRRSPERLSWKLLAAKVGEWGNPAFSGVSLAEALSIARIGASGDVATELQELLGIPPTLDCGPASLGGAWRAARGDLEKADRSVTWRTVAGAWLARGLGPKKLWTAVAKNEFGATVREVDFGTAAVHSQINAWVRKMTSGKIDKLLEQRLDANTLFVLANALFFDAKWTHAFPTAATRPATFRGVAGDVSVPMMETRGSFAYAANDNGAVVRLPYGDTGAFEMIAWLPPENRSLADVVDERGRQALGALVEAATPRPGTVRLPKFRVDAFSPDLSSALQTLGATRIFSFSRDWSLLAPEKETRISRVAHRVVVDVTEQGTTVAAATAVVGVKRSALLEKPFVFDANRPFVYVVRHQPTNVWVALGAYQAP